MNLVGLARKMRGILEVSGHLYIAGVNPSTRWRAHLLGVRTFRGNYGYGSGPTLDDALKNLADRVRGRLLYRPHSKNGFRVPNDLTIR